MPLMPGCMPPLCGAVQYLRIGVTAGIKADTFDCLLHDTFWQIEGSTAGAALKKADFLLFPVIRPRDGHPPGPGFPSGLCLLSRLLLLMPSWRDPCVVVLASLRSPHTP